MKTVLQIQEQEKVTQPTWNLFAMMQLMFGTFCFVIMDQQCSLATDDDCLNHFIVPNLTRWIALLLICAVSILWVLMLAIKGRVSKVYYLAEIVIIYLLVLYP
jgi:hypothetical protein